MRKINLVYVITKLELGGAQKQLLSLIRHLDKEKLKLFLFTAKNGLLMPEALSIDGLTIKRSLWLERSINPLKDFLTLIEIYKFIKKNNIDIVHTHSSKAGILGRWGAKLAKVKIVLHTVHGWSFNDYQSILTRRFFIWLERITALFTDKLIVVSNYDKQRGLVNHIGDQDKYSIIRYGIDYTEFDIQDQNIRKELGIDTHDLVVGMISCFKPQKSHRDFIKLASLVNRSLPEVKFLLVGDGVLRSKIERFIHKFNLQGSVILTGWRKDISRILSGLDVFVLTSLWEGLPVSVLEAMAASLPVVVTSTGGVGEIVKEDKNGFCVPICDIQQMSEKLVSLLKDENLRKQMGQNARSSLDFNFKSENMLRNTQDLYENLISEKEIEYAN
jgi:glycosyltransferase involved in cell wall biosynthesis